MGKSISGKLDDYRKFLEKNAKSDLNLKQVQTALLDVDKASTELSALKARLGELSGARREMIARLDEAMTRVKLEKRLRAKEAKVKAKLADLASPSGDKK